MNKSEENHIMRIKNMPCGVCGAYPPSDAHHILENGTRVGHYVVIPLCKSCHQDSHNGIHGEKAMWRIYKKTELIVLGDVIKRIYD